VNGDGGNDILYRVHGAAYVTFTPPAGDVDVTSADWSATFGAYFTDYYTHAVMGTDFDGDGAGDLLIGDPGEAAGDESRVCGRYGSLAAGTSDCDTADLRYVRTGEQAAIGMAMAPVADVTGDGLPELLVTEPFNDDHYNDAGAAYLLSIGGL